MCLVETTLTLIGDNSYLFLFAFSLDIFIVRIFRASEQGDESGCTMVVIQITGGEGCQRFAVQAVWGSGFGFDDVPFIEFEFDFAGYVLLCRLYKCLDSFTKRSEPFSLVYYLSQVIAYFLFSLLWRHGPESTLPAVHVLLSEMVPPVVNFQRIFRRE